MTYYDTQQFKIAKQDKKKRLRVQECLEIHKGLTCPLAIGNYDLTETIDIPNVPISGKVQATAHINDQNSKEIACVVLSVKV